MHFGDRSVEVLAIDLDDTLIDADGSRAEVLAAVDRLAVTRFGAPPGSLGTSAPNVLDQIWPQQPHGEQFRRLGFAKSDALWVDFDGPGEVLAAIRAWLPGFRHQFWTGVCAASQVRPRASEELSHAFITLRRKRIRTFAGVQRALAALQRRFRLVLITNGPSDLQRLKLRRTNLAQYFDAVLISGEVGVAKPEAGIFRGATVVTETKPEHLLMVGDDHVRDIVGARTVGIQGVLVASSTGHSRHLRGRSSFDGAAVIDSFTDLPALLLSDGR